LLIVDTKELKFETSRSSGPGGQHVNKVSTQVTLCFDVEASASLTAEQKKRIQRMLEHRINKEGVLRVTSRKHRSQLANRKAAIERFVGLLTEALAIPKRRYKTKKPRVAIERRLEQKTKRSRLKQLRQKPNREAE